MTKSQIRNDWHRKSQQIAEQWKGMNALLREKNQIEFMDLDDNAKDVKQTKMNRDKVPNTKARVMPHH